MNGLAVNWKYCSQVRLELEFTFRIRPLSFYTHNAFTFWMNQSKRLVFHAAFFYGGVVDFCKTTLSFIRPLVSNPFAITYLVKNIVRLSRT